MGFKHRVIAGMTSLLLVCAFAPASPARAEVNVSFDLFYSDLSPHGSWLVSAEYGRVWQPRVSARDWNPYYDGHWEYADVGWTWVSDYAWGGIPYHYGTWVLEPAVGWVWVPGYTWAPAWVVFRTGPDYIGWAPVAPSFALGMSFGGSTPVSGSFLFVSTHDFCAPKIRSYVVPERNARTIAEHTTIVNNLIVQNNMVVNRGPDVRAVEAASHRKIEVTQVESLPRVAPFAQVQRTQLAIAPARGRSSIRATEPESANRPLPSKETAQLSRETPRGNPYASPPSPERAAPRHETAPPNPHVMPQEKPRSASEPRKAPDKPGAAKHDAAPPDPRAMPQEKPHPAPEPKLDKTVKPPPKAKATKPPKKDAKKPKTDEPKKDHEGQSDPS